MNCVTKDQKEPHERFFFFFVGGAVTSMVYAAVVPATAPFPGEVAVTVHCPVPRTVSVVWLITHGPVSFSRTVAPEAEVAVKAVLVPARSEIGSPGFQGVPPAGITVMESVPRAGCTFTTWLAVPLKPGVLPV